MSYFPVFLKLFGLLKTECIRELLKIDLPAIGEQVEDGCVVSETGYVSTVHHVDYNVAVLEDLSISILQHTFKAALGEVGADVK